MKESDDLRPEVSSEHRGPNPGIVSTVFALLFIAALVPVTLLVSETHFPAPVQPTEQIVAYFKAETVKVRICAFLQFCSAIPLGVFTAAMVSRLRYHGAQAAWVMIALFGGLAASSAVALSALIQWTIAQPGIAEEGALTRALYFLIFAFGGPCFSVPLGLLTAGLSVPAGHMSLLPRWLVVFGVILGVAGALSALDLLTHRALFLIPLTRFPGFVWMIVAGFKLPGRARPATAEL
jgi:hypothetical protein